jgi:hypothetical protein
MKVRVLIGAGAVSLAMLTATTGSAVAATSHDSPTSPSNAALALIQKLGANGGGTFASPQGQEFRQALADSGAPSGGFAAAVSPSTAAAASYADCTGTFNDTSAIVTLQESATSIPWGVKLTPANAIFGEVLFNNETWANNRQQNGYQEHFEPWSYLFHSNLGNPFQVKGGGSYKMPSGATVSFYWYWNSYSNPNEGGYAWVNCIYRPGVN